MLYNSQRITEELVSVPLNPQLRNIAYRAARSDGPGMTLAAAAGARNAGTARAHVSPGVTDTRNTASTATNRRRAAPSSRPQSWS